MTNAKTAILTAMLVLGSLMGGANALTLKSATVKPPVGPGSIAAPGGGGLEDTYCKNGHATFPACDAAFAAACKKAGGTMSGTQGWGGKSCWEPS